MARPIGRLTKKTQCQLSAWVRIPPASRPREPPATDTNTYALIARMRSLGIVNSVMMIARITEAWAAAPTPCRKRAAIERALARRDAAQERGGGERDEAREEHALAAGEIADPPRQQEQAPESDEERVDDPREVRLAEMEVALNRGQRDVHDCDVEHDHQLRQAHDHERRPATGVRWGSLRRDEIHAVPNLSVIQ